ncbi:MAG: PEP-CTERM sorting domain-containing protein [Akkermansiaceae bacterium]|nr:PEP-CTERM sorting domain-containing protein [Akkermansiaceae bacterium]
MTSNLAAVAASALALTGLSANAATVWNVNVGNEVDTSHEITTADDYVGAATENTANSTWNPISSTVSTTLADSTGDSSAGVTIGMSSGVDFGVTVQIEGDEVFKTWMKDAGNDESYSVTFGGLSTSPGTSYDLVIYSGWIWGPEGVHTAQSEGTGLAGTFVINSLAMGPGNFFASGGLGEDSNAADVAGNTNYARFNGLAADGSGNLTFDFNLGGDLDAPINGFQLIETVPEPSTTALLGLGGLALILRRRK